MVEVKSRALLTPGGGADASCGSSKSLSQGQHGGLSHIRSTPAPIISWPLTCLVTLWQTETFVTADVYLHCREHLARFKFSLMKMNFT